MKRKKKKVVNLLPFVLLFGIPFLCSYTYFTISDHISVYHEYYGPTYKEVFRHFTEGCENFGTDNRE